MLYLGAKRSLLSAGKSPAQQVAALFAAGEQGAWYEPSLTNGTLFQDSAGTLPVTAVGQPVGLMLDKRLGLVRGVELRATGAVEAVGATTLATYNTASGDGTASRIDISNQSYVRFPGVPANTTVEITIANTGATTLQLRAGSGFGVAIATAVAAGVATTFRASSGSTPGGLLVAVGVVAGDISFRVTSIRELPGNHATQPTAINRPVLQIDGNGRHFLAFNGTNSWMSTAAIDFTGADKMTVVEGVRKLSDEALGAVTELSTASTNPGSFYIIMPLNAGAASVGMSAGGTTRVAIARTGLAAPLSLVATLRADIGAPLLSAGVNGSPTTSVSPLGAGNFGNYPLYIGARAGSSLYFNGNIYGLIIRGAQSSDSQIASAERFMNAKTGAY